MLESARDHYRRQQNLTARAVAEARRRANRGLGSVAQAIRAYQVLAITLALQAGAAELAEQNIAAPPVAAVNPSALLTGEAELAARLEKATDGYVLDRLVATFVQDAGRTASAVDMARRPGVDGYVRVLNPPSCSRCAILAGRFYGWSSGFRRHPLCDCIHQMSTHQAAVGQTVDVAAMAAAGQIMGLTSVQGEAILAGAEPSQVVNTTSRAAGLTVSSSVLQRSGRSTPAEVLALADGDRTVAIAGLRANGYLAA